MLNHVKQILLKRMSLNIEDDFNIEKSRAELIKVLSQNKYKTIEVLNQLNENEILYTSEVFEEISYNLKSFDYINCLKHIEQKYSNLDISDAIKVAEEYI